MSFDLNFKFHNKNFAYCKFSTETSVMLIYVAIDLVIVRSSVTCAFRLQKIGNSFLWCWIASFFGCLPQHALVELLASYVKHRHCMTQEFLFIDNLVKFLLVTYFSHHALTFQFCNSLHEKHLIIINYLTQIYIKTQFLLRSN